ncbi:MAG: BatD family protein [Elusimicrobiota bacterium]
MLQIKKKIGLIFLILISLFIARFVHSSSISVYASVSNSTITLNNETYLKLTVAGAGFFPKPDLPNIPDFSINQTGQYTGIDFSKGSPLPYTVFEYILIPTKTGAFKIPEIYVEHKGYYYATKPIEITVIKKAEILPAPEQVTAEVQRLDVQGAPPIFVKTQISTKDALYNQQLIYTYTLFTRLSIQELPKAVFPEYEAYHREILTYKRLYYAKINDVLYRAIEFKTALFPFMTGKHIIPSVKFKCSKSCFPEASLADGGLKSEFKEKDSFFIKGRDIPVTTTILPLKDKPLSFSGLIGAFDIFSEVDKTIIPMDGYVVLTVHVKGLGNLRSIPDINAPLMDTLREYQVDNFLNYNKNAKEVNGEKLFRIVMVPRELGEEEIPSIGFSYYDIKEKTYLTKWTDPIKIKVVEAEKKNVSEGIEKPEQKSFINKLKSSKWLEISEIFILVLLVFLLIIRRKKLTKDNGKNIIK